MPDKCRFNARQLMKKAIDTMRQSISEPRSDGKVSPKVGAVLFLNGEILTACRGELRHGDHAEYTLLERKNRDRALDGGILFATLEPCAPGARSHPKLSCAERIVNARIAKVYIGIEDDDPSVARKGMEYLEKHGVEWEMFDRDLQREIYEENKEFFAWARSQAGWEEPPPASTKLSDLEDTVEGTTPGDFSPAALEHYRQDASISHAHGSEEFNRLLEQQGFLTLAGDDFHPTRMGILMFGSEPRITLPEAGLLATVTFPDGTQARHNFEEALVLIPDAVERWLQSILPQIIDRSQMKRKETVDLPFEMIREGIVNALVHRDYEIKGAKCQLQVTADTITILSPGHPIKPITLEQLQEFDAPMISRNPALHYVFYRMGLAEERGIGLSSLRDRAKDLRLPIPRFSFRDPYLSLTVYRSKEAAVRSVPSEVSSKLNKSQAKGWQWVSTQEFFTSKDYVEKEKVSERTALRHLYDFIELGLIEKEGSGPSTKYKVLRV